MAPFHFTLNCMNRITYICVIISFCIFNICAAQIQRVRIDFVSPDDYTRHLLLAFTPDNAATDGYDYGYDALNIEDFPNDLNWMIGEDRFIIQGVGAFDDSKQYSLGLFLADSGDIEIVLTDLENFDSDIDVFVYDLLLDSYTRINDENFKMSIEANIYHNRFFIAFSKPDDSGSSMDEVDSSPVDELEIAPSDVPEEISLKYLTKNNEVFLQVPETVEIKKVYLINLFGQVENSWSPSNSKLSHEFRTQVSGVARGTYILRVETNTSSLNKKILINY